MRRPRAGRAGGGPAARSERRARGDPEEVAAPPNHGQACQGKGGDGRAAGEPLPLLTPRSPFFFLRRFTVFEYCGSLFALVLMLRSLTQNTNLNPPPFLLPFH